MNSWGIRFFPTKDQLIVVDLDMRFKVGLDEVHFNLNNLSSDGWCGSLSFLVCMSNLIEMS